jgi:hypothetical protein
MTASESMSYAAVYKFGFQNHDDHGIANDDLVKNFEEKAAIAT